MRGKRKIWILQWGESGMYAGPKSKPGDSDLVFRTEDAARFETFRMAEKTGRSFDPKGQWKPVPFWIVIYDEHVGSPLIGKNFIDET